MSVIAASVTHSHGPVDNLEASSLFWSTFCAIKNCHTFTVRNLALVTNLNGFSTKYTSQIA